MSDAIHFETLKHVASMIEKRQLSSMELTRSMLDRIQAVDPKLHSYASVMHEQALAAAELADKEIANGDYKGPLHGVPIAVKDLCYTKGVATVGGLRVRKDFVPEFNATVVTKLLSAGAVLLGKLNLTEGALSGYNEAFEIPVNPWGENLWAGVSSSGSGVATAAGLCFGSLGTDTGGSIRYPSMANGIVGLKPSYGRVSRHGVLELAGSLDHVGPMTRSVADAAIMLEAISGFDNNDTTSLDAELSSFTALDTENLKGCKIGIDENYITEGTNSGLVVAIEKVMKTLKSLGAELVPVSMPKDGPMDLRNAWVPVTAYEAYRAHSEFYPSRASEYGGYLGDVLKLGSTMTLEDYTKAQASRKDIADRFKAELAKVDAVICPSGGSVFPVEKEVQYGNMETLKPVIKNFQGQFTIPADLAGTPALTVPCGFSSENTPYAVQFLGKSLSEMVLCRIGAAYEAVTDWHQHHPNC